MCLGGGAQLGTHGATGATWGVHHVVVAARGVGLDVEVVHDDGVAAVPRDLAVLAVTVAAGAAGDVGAALVVRALDAVVALGDDARARHCHRVHGREHAHAEREHGGEPAPASTSR